MRDAGLYSRDQIRVINETRMWAFWKLGKLLAKVDRGSGPGRGKKVDVLHPSFRAFIAALDPPLDGNRAKEHQRIGTMPQREMEKAIAQAHKVDEDLTISGLLRTARPWWYKASRQ